MKNKLLFPIVALALVFSLVACNKSGKLNTPSKNTPPAGPVELKIKWTAGERVVQNLDMKMENQINLPARPAPMKQDMTMGQKYALTVLKEDPDGGHEVEMEFLSARMEMTVDGKPMMKYDSANSSSTDSTNPVAGVLGKVVGCKIRYFMDASNNVVRMEGIDELISKVSAGSPAAAVAPLKSMYGEGYFKQMMSSSRFMPSKAVAPGDTWPVQNEFPMGPLGNMALNYTFTFQGWEMHGKRNCARLEFVGTIKTTPDATAGSAGIKMDIQDGSTSGVSWFDPELGITIETQMNQNMKMAMTFPKNPKLKTQIPSMTNQLNQVLTIKLDSLE
jgi:predicted small lipoprotein YifL